MSAQESPLATRRSSSDDKARRLQNYVGGGWTEVAGEWLEDIEPGDRRTDRAGARCRALPRWTPQSPLPGSLSRSGGPSRLSAEPGR